MAGGHSQYYGSYELVAHGREGEQIFRDRDESFFSLYRIDHMGRAILPACMIPCRIPLLERIAWMSERNNTVISRAILSPGRPVHERPETKAFFPPQKNVSCLVTIVARSIAQSISSECHSETDPSSDIPIQRLEKSMPSPSISFP